MKRPKIGVAVFVWKNDKFLIMQRNGAHGEGTWSVPGGHLEYNESWEECARREVMEETGMEIANVRFLTVTNDIFHSESKHFNTIWVESDWAKNKPINLEPSKCTDMYWTDTSNLPEPLFEPCWSNLRKMAPELFTATSQQR